MSSFDLNSACKQREKRMLFTYPTNRLELISPYINTSLTQHDLDMRRKAEILEYSGNSQASKGNNLTKKQQIAQSMSGRYQNKGYNYTTYYEETQTLRTATDIVESTYNLVVERDASNNIDESCDSGIIYTPTTSSGVPGPVINLYKDPSIPLYNYVKNSNSLALTNGIDPDKWRIIINDNVEIADDTSGTSFLLGIMGGIDESMYTFDFEMPIGIYIRGTTNTLIDEYNNLSVNLNVAGGSLSIDMDVLYNDQNVTQIGNSNELVPTIYYEFDLSGEINATTLSNNSNIGISFDLSGAVINKDSNVGSYEIKYYLGQLKVKNIPLYTEKGYIYDLVAKNNLLFTIDTQGKYNEEFNNTEYGIIYNITDDSKYSFTNASLNTSASNVQYTPFKINGINYNSSEINYNSNNFGGNIDGGNSDVSGGNAGGSGSGGNIGDGGSSGSSGYTY
jgi:uncharacterized membrane protein YgcG